MNFHPRGWTPGKTEHRFAGTAPSSYSSQNHTVDAVISMGSPVVRFYGTEKLRISPDAVIADRVGSSGIPVLDSHQQTGISNALGRITKVWFRNALMGTIAFNDTPEGRKAEGMVARGEIAGISAGYTVREWEITDAKGNVLDPEVQRINFDDDLTFTATRWELLECSLVSVPADSAAMVRSLGGGSDHRRIIADVQARMLARHRISVRQNMYDERSALDGHYD
jgi:phage head maturation protease